MSNQQPSVSYHRVVTVALIVLNVVAACWAISAGSPGRWDYHFGEDSFVTWLGSAQMFGAALLFLACYFAGTIIRLQAPEQRSNTTWLVFALGFFVLALDQQFRIREHLTLLIDGAPAGLSGDSSTPLLIKLVLTAMAIAVVGYFRATVLANFRMVVAFMGGFWFLIIMLLASVLFESMGLSAQLAKVFEGTGKLLAMAMFLSGSYVVLLDRLSAAHAMAQLGFFGERRRRQLPLVFPDRRSSGVELCVPGEGGETEAAAGEVPAAEPAEPAAEPAEPVAEQAEPAVEAAEPAVEAAAREAPNAGTMTTDVVAKRNT